MVNPRDLEEQFGIIEHRVKALRSQNRALLDRIAQLEREIAEARSDAQSTRQMSGITSQVRERIEKVLQSLETINAANQRETEGSP